MQLIELPVLSSLLSIGQLFAELLKVNAVRHYPDPVLPLMKFFAQICLLRRSKLLPVDE